MTEKLKKMEWTGVMLEIDGVGVAYPIGENEVLMEQIVVAWNTRPRQAAWNAMVEALEAVSECQYNSYLDNAIHQARVALKQAKEQP